jgi:hypothetical protein
VISFVVELEGGVFVRKGLEDLEAAIPKVSRERIYNALRRVLKRMRDQPPALASYRRTGDLRAGWPLRPERIGSADNAYRIYNYVEYTRYVVGDSEGYGQAWFHVGRWENFRDVVAEEVENLPREIEDMLIMYAF